MKISVRTIEALVEVISGGPGGGLTPPSIGKYRTGSEIERFLRHCGVPFSIATGSSRQSALRKALEDTQEQGEAGRLKEIIEKCADPFDFIGQDDKQQRVMAYLNQALVRDGLRLELIDDFLSGGSVVKLRETTEAQALSPLTQALQTISFDTVRRDLDRALTSIDEDPESTVTSACSVIESVCRSIIVELDQTQMPQSRNIRQLYQVVSRLLELTPGRDDLPLEIADDMRTILRGLTTMIQGIGALRTHGGDAHGREQGFQRIDARFARLAIHSACTAALFLIETWQQKYPGRTLHTELP